MIGNNLVRIGFEPFYGDSQKCIGNSCEQILASCKRYSRGRERPPNRRSVALPSL